MPSQTPKGSTTSVRFHLDRTRLRVVSPGFTPYEKTELTIAAGPRTTHDVRLVVTLEKQVITVTEEQGLNTDPQNNADAVVLKGPDLDVLPDDPEALSAAVQAMAGPSAGPNGGQIFIDGFTGGRMPPKESIREVRINQNPFNAENNNIGFGNIEIFTKPGADKLRGSTFFNFGDESLNSRNPFAPSAHLSKCDISAAVSVARLLKASRHSFLIFSDALLTTMRSSTPRF